MSTSTTNKLLIFNSILLVLILAVVVTLNLDGLKNRFETLSEESGGADNEDDLETKYYPKQDSLIVDFDGLKNDTIQLPDEIIELLATNLDSFNWNNEFQDEELNSLYHLTIFAQQFPAEKALLQKLIIIIFSNYTGNLYHAAAGRISLFEFQKEQQDWKLARYYPAFGYGTEYGLEPLWCKLAQIGNNNKYAVIVQTNYSGNGGHEVESQTVYSEVGCSFELVFDFTNYEHYEDYPNDIEYTEGYSNMRFLKSKKAWFDIETKSEGSELYNIAPGEPKRYVFNGEEYAEVK